MTNALDQLIGSTAYDSAGSKIGKIKSLYLDEHTAQPVWATVHGGLFGLSHSVVPVAGAHAQGDSITVPVTKDAVKAAPSVDAGARINPQEEAQLLRHYHLRRPTDPATQDQQAHEAPGAAQSPAQGRAPAVTPPVPDGHRPESLDAAKGVAAPGHGRHEAPEPPPHL
jgi:hypothetical protein